MPLEGDKTDEEINDLFISQRYTKIVKTDTKRFKETINSCHWSLRATRDFSAPTHMV